MKLLIALENAALMFGFGITYFIAGFDWLVFVLLFFAPDLSFAAYLAGPRVGAWVYNLAHHMGIGIAMIILGWYFNIPMLSGAGLIMTTHSAFDRMLGYGLKHESGFKDTHLGRIGKD